MSNAPHIFSNGQIVEWASLHLPVGPYTVCVSTGRYDAVHILDPDMEHVTEHGEPLTYNADAQGVADAIKRAQRLANDPPSDTAAIQ